MSCRVLGLFIEAAARNHTSLETLVAGLPVTSKQLKDTSERIDWATFCALSERLEVMCGGPAGVEEAGAGFAKDPVIRRINTVFGLVTSPRAIYWASHRWFGAAMFTVIASTFEDVQIGQIRVTLRIPDEYQDCPQFFRINAGVFRINPRMLGLPDAVVRFEIAPRKCVYVIDLPPSLTVWARLRRSIGALLSARDIFEELGSQQQRLRARFDEANRAHRQVAAHVDLLHTLNDLGRDLAQHKEMAELGAAVSRALIDRLGCSGVAILIAGSPGSPAEVVYQHGDCPDTAKVFPLTKGGDLVGQIKVWGARAGNADAPSLKVEDLLPWIGLALDNVRAFQLLRQSQNTLEERVAARTVELQKSQTELEASLDKVTKLDRQKTEFFANASHELRTPLTLMLAPIEQVIALAGMPGTANDELRSVLRSGYRLMKLINDLLDLSKLEAGRMRLRMGPTDLSRLLEEVIRPWRPVLQRRKVTLKVEIAPALQLTADAERLEQVALNLLSNAVKFVPDGGELRITAASTVSGLEFAIENSGEGIATEELSQLFSRFAQSSHSSARRFGSTGLGLPVVRELVELHGGTVTVENTPGERIGFRVSLPSVRDPSFDERPLDVPRPSLAELRQYEVLSEAEPLPESPARLPEAEDQLTLLIAEDNADLRRFLVRTLRSTFQIIEAENGRRALKLARDRLPDIILSDLMMPEMDGGELCQHLKGDPKTANIPIILLTARGDLDAKIAMLERGADDYLVKPFHVEELKSRLRAQLRIRALGEQVVQREKLVALGTMVAGVAHEIRNPLNGILNSLLPLREMIGTQNPEAVELMDLALMGARRVEDISSQLLRQVRAGEGSRFDVNLVDNIRLALQLLSHKADPGPRIVSNYPAAGLIHVFADPSALNQVWINLIDNAIQAAGPDGQVTVTVGQHAEGARVEVSDSGAGIAPNVLGRIFDPFFTTKPVGMGTGLGLSLVRDIVHKHGGRITVRSKVGEGASFQVTLPASEAVGGIHAHG